jgi:hypothetical protein
MAMSAAACGEDKKNNPGGCTCDLTASGQHVTFNQCGQVMCIGGRNYVCNGNGAPTDSGTCGAGAQLTCLSHTWCDSHEVTRWNGQTLPAQTGGTIPDGLYREAYLLAPQGTGMTFGDYPDAFLLQAGEFRSLGALGGLGTYTTTSGNPAQLTFVNTTSCNDETGENTGSSNYQRQFTYLVDSGYLFLFEQETGSVTQTIARAYKRVQSLCGEVADSVPTTPGDSFTCHTTNCGCTEGVNAVADHDTCVYVHGG